MNLEGFGMRLETSWRREVAAGPELYSELNTCQREYMGAWGSCLQGLWASVKTLSWPLLRGGWDLVCSQKSSTIIPFHRSLEAMAGNSGQESCSSAGLQSHSHLAQNLLLAIFR